MVDILLRTLIYAGCIDIVYGEIGKSFNTKISKFSIGQYYNEIAVGSENGTEIYRDVNIIQCMGDMLIFSHTDHVSIDKSGVITYQKCLKVTNVHAIIHIR